MVGTSNLGSWNGQWSNPISSDHAAGGPRQSWWVSQSTAGAAEPSETIFIVQPELISPDCNTISYEHVLTIYIYIVLLRANTPIRPQPFYAAHFGISNVRLYIQFGRSTRVFREYKFPTPVKLLHSLKIFNKVLILPPRLNFYIHWRSSIRV